MLEISVYKVRRFFNILVQHDDLQGDVYWEFVFILFARALKITFWGNTSGKYTIPSFTWRLR